MNCVLQSIDELHRDGWMVNQSRMWMASQWTVRSGADWRDGDDEMFRHLLDGSRAANRQGWQWVVGGVRNRTYGFARQQVEKRAPTYCVACTLRDACPIEAYPSPAADAMIDPAPAMSTALLGPIVGQIDFQAADEQRPSNAVWLTAESLGDADPALVAHPDLPVHFVFDERLLDQLRLDGKRLVFLADTLADLAQRRDLHVWRGDPLDLLEGRHDDLDGVAFATTRAPVPGFGSLLERTANDPALEDWRWLRAPTAALAERMAGKRFPSFRDWCRITEPDDG